MYPSLKLKRQKVELIYARLNNMIYCQTTNILELEFFNLSLLPNLCS
jgi:hypothetical protein